MRIEESKECFELAVLDDRRSHHGNQKNSTHISVSNTCSETKTKTMLEAATHLSFNEETIKHWAHYFLQPSISDRSPAQNDIFFVAVAKKKLLK